MQLKVLSLFSGIGAFEKALSNIDTDYEVVGFSEINKYSVEAYCAIHGVDSQLNLGDITEVDLHNIKPFNLMTYGFPCQDISTAGYLLGFEKDTRSSLLWNAMEVAKHYRPDFMVGENVKNILSRSFKDGFSKWQDYLNDIGYVNKVLLLNAMDFGLPQNRSRVFVVSIRKDVVDKPIVKDCVFKQKTIGDLLQKSIPKHLYLSASTIERMNKLIIQRGVVKRDYIPTLTTEVKKGCGKHFAPAWIKTIGEYRRPTPLECFRFMGFDDEDFYKAKEAIDKKFHKGKDRSNSALYIMAANSIAVPVLEHLFCESFK